MVPELAKIKATVSLVSSMTGGLYTHETKKTKTNLLLFFPYLAKNIRLKKNEYNRAHSVKDFF